jgi:uncharacterized phage protein (predicted DNA packaging)
MTLLEKVKANLILEHTADDELLQLYISASVSYAESYLQLTEHYYTDHQMPPTTEQAVIMLSSHFYESRTAALAAFSLTMCKPDSRCGIRSTSYFA